MKTELLEKAKLELEKTNTEIKRGFGVKKQKDLFLDENLRTNLPKINENIQTILKNTDKDERDLESLNELEKASKEIYDYSSELKQDLETELFFSKGKFFDEKSLRQQYKQKNLKKKFPKFNLDRYFRFLHNPITEIKNFAGQVIYYDKFWIRKNLIAINQMIFNEMDLYILNIGKEGSGKSCWSSQQILYFYTFLKEVGLIDYAYDVTRMFFTDIMSYLEEHSNQKKDDLFRIEVLDEGNDLNRSNFRDETNRQFKYEMRTDRRQLRITLINMQQIGELDTSISLSRINFIYNCKVRSDVKTGTLRKGYVDMYIIPRTNQIYSEVRQKNLERNDILNSFANILDRKKDYYINLPTENVARRFKFEDKWGFDKDAYNDHVKDEMKKHKYTSKVKITELQAYILSEKISPVFGKLKVFDHRVKSDQKQYEVLRKLFQRIDNYFTYNPEKKKSIQNYYEK